ncbi:MAG: hypothetical protein IJZ20_04175, partial [Clostridia bacterium]|nr:hypothetical protein [Clostridia bacterium]
MGRIKYLILLIFNLAIVAGVYNYLLNTLHFFPAMAIYQIIAIIAICTYLLLFFHHNNEIGKAKMRGEDLPEELLQRRRNRLKAVVVLLSPFVFT